MVTSAVVLAYATAVASPIARFNDFHREDWPPYLALAHGHLGAFVQLAPAYVGSLVLRAPFALIPSFWGGGWRAVYFASALPCVIAAPIFGAWLAVYHRRPGVDDAIRLGPLVFCIVSPIALLAVFGGHPEEVLGAVLCVVGVILAARGSVGWASLLIGLAVINKSSALIAVPVALAVMPSGRRRALLIVAATVGCVLIPVLAARQHGLTATGAQLGTGVGTIFNPAQLLWWFGPHSWIAAHARPAIVLASVACTAIWWVRRGRARASTHDISDAMLLLALVALLRCALDPWNNPSYHLSFLFALLAYEVWSGRKPILTVVYSLLILLVVPVNVIPHNSQDVQAALYATIVIPTIAWLAARLYWPDAWERLVKAVRPVVPRRTAVSAR